MWLWENISKLLKIFNLRPVTPYPYIQARPWPHCNQLSEWLFSLAVDIFATCWSAVGEKLWCHCLCVHPPWEYSAPHNIPLDTSCQLTANRITSPDDDGSRVATQPSQEVRRNHWTQPYEKHFDRMLRRKNINHEWVHIAWTAISVGDFQLTFSRGWEKMLYWFVKQCGSVIVDCESGGSGGW